MENYSLLIVTKKARHARVESYSGSPVMQFPSYQFTGHPWDSEITQSIRCQLYIHMNGLEMRYVFRLSLFDAIKFAVAIISTPKPGSFANFRFIFDSSEP